MTYGKLTLKDRITIAIRTSRDAVGKENLREDFSLLVNQVCEDLEIPLPAEGEITTYRQLIQYAKETAKYDSVSSSI